MAEPSISGGVEPHIQQFAEIYGLTVDVARRVVEGELTLEDAVEGQAPETETPVEPPPAAAPAPPEPPHRFPDVSSGTNRRRVASFDPAFRPAVEAGLLTVQQAVERGERQAFAARLSRKHGIPLGQALKVADNRARLAEVVQKQRSARKRAARPAAGRPRKSRSSRARRSVQVAVISLSLLGVAAAGFWGVGRWKAEERQARQMAERFAQAPPGAAEEPATRPDPEDLMNRLVEIDKNEMGMLASVVGPDPRAVLHAYCGAVPGLKPLGLADTVPAFTGSRLGVFHDLSSAEQKSIVIRRDTRTGQWRAGDGTHPISPRVEQRPLRLHPSR